MFHDEFEDEFEDHDCFSEEYVKKNVFLFDGWIVKENEESSSQATSAIHEGVPAEVEVFFGGKGLGTCPSCNKELIRVLTVKGKPTVPFLHLFFPDNEPFEEVHLPLVFCPRCAIYLKYRFTKKGEVEVLGVTEGFYGNEYQGDDFPYEKYPDFFPVKAARLIPIPTIFAEIFSNIHFHSNVGRRGRATLRDLISEKVLDRKRAEEFCEWFKENVSSELLTNHPLNLLDGEWVRNQLFGTPFLLQENDLVQCNDCYVPMVCVGGFFGLLNIGLNLFGEKENNFVEVQFWFCRNCLYIESYAEVD